MYIYLESSNFSQDFFPFEIQFDAINSIDISLLLFETREREKEIHIAYFNFSQRKVKRFNRRYIPSI